MAATLYYIHDPMCSWCWGYRPEWDALQQVLPKSITVQYVAGGLAPDTDIPMPIEQQKTIQRHWHNIQQKLGTEFNFDFWTKNTPYRSTYIACRAVIASQQQGFQTQMLDAIQRAYYLRALNPSNSEVLVQLATELSQQHGLQLIIDVSQFEKDLNSFETQDKLTKDILLAQELTQQGFPSLVFEQQGKRYSIAVDYLNHKTSLAQIQQVITLDNK
jgi:putative protein-disulfide isomerase